MWHQRSNGYRKCYYNKKQRQLCRIKFQQLATKISELQFTKKEFLHFFNHTITICVLPEIEKNKPLGWKQFIQLKKAKNKLFKAYRYGLTTT